MRLWIGLAVAAVGLAVVPRASAQLPPGYWSYYDSGNNQYHRRAADYELRRQRPANRSSHQPFAAPLATDRADYAGRGLTGNGFSAYQGNGYQGGGQNLYYGYWDGGFNTGVYGFSMYPHFNRPGFTYWQ
jgi:hypothetical protein